MRSELIMKTYLIISILYMSMGSIINPEKDTLHDTTIKNCPIERDVDIIYVMKVLLHDSFESDRNKANLEKFDPAGIDTLTIGSNFHDSLKRYWESQEVYSVKNQETCMQIHSMIKNENVNTEDPYFFVFYHVKNMYIAMNVTQAMSDSNIKRVFILDENVELIHSFLLN